MLVAFLAVLAQSYAEWAIPAEAPPVASSTVPRPPEVIADLNAGLLSALMNMRPDGGLGESAQPWVLRAAFTSAGRAAVILGIGGQERSYQVGDVVADGSVLRRIEPEGAVFWREGREELLRYWPKPSLIVPARAAVAKPTSLFHPITPESPDDL